MVVRAAHLAALAIEDDQRRSAAPALPARLAERVRRKLSGRDGHGDIGTGLPWHSSMQQEETPDGDPHQPGGWGDSEGAQPAGATALRGPIMPRKKPRKRISLGMRPGGTSPMRR